MVFQDPYASLNSRMSAGDIIAEPWRTHKTMYTSRRDRDTRVRELLDLVGLGAKAAGKYPQEFSGGQRQRIGIARALALNPDVIICDEPVSALDLSVQAQVLNLLNDLQQQLGISYIFISHDLSVVRHVADRVAVMYLGRIIETGPTEAVFDRANHPYTAALMSAAPKLDAAQRGSRILLKGEVPRRSIRPRVAGSGPGAGRPPRSARRRRHRSPSIHRSAITVPNAITRCRPNRLARCRSRRERRLLRDNRGGDTPGVVHAGLDRIRHGHAGRRSWRSSIQPDPRHPDHAGHHGHAAGGDGGNTSTSIWPGPDGRWPDGYRAPSRVLLLMALPEKALALMLAGVVLAGVVLTSVGWVPVPHRATWCWPAPRPACSARRRRSAGHRWRWCGRTPAAPGCAER